MHTARDAFEGMQWGQHLYDKDPSLRTKRSQWTRTPPDTRAFFLVLERRPVELASCETGGGRSEGRWTSTGIFSVMAEGVRSSRLVEVADQEAKELPERKSIGTGAGEGDAGGHEGVGGVEDSDGDDKHDGRTS